MTFVIFVLMIIIMAISIVSIIVVVSCNGFFFIAVYTGVEDSFEPLLGWCC